MKRFLVTLAILLALLIATPVAAQDSPPVASQWVCGQYQLGMYTVGATAQAWARNLSPNSEGIQFVEVFLNVHDNDHEYPTLTVPPLAPGQFVLLTTYTTFDGADVTLWWLDAEHCSASGGINPPPGDPPPPAPPPGPRLDCYQFDKGNLWNTVPSTPSRIWVTNEAREKLREYGGYAEIDNEKQTVAIWTNADESYTGLILIEDSFGTQEVFLLQPGINTNCEGAWGCIRIPPVPYEPAPPCVTCAA